MLCKSGLAAALLAFAITAKSQHADGFFETVLARPDGGAWQEAVGITFQENGRTWVWERGGRLWIIDETSPVTTPFLDISDEVGAWHDHGMLGFALDPKFDQNGHVYLLYLVDRHHLMNCSEPASGAGPPICGAGYDPATDEYFDATIGRLTRYTAVMPGGATDFSQATTADLGSRIVLIGTTPNSGIPSTSRSHVTGSLMFGTDGTLLVTTGDGAQSSNDSGSGSTSGSSKSYTARALADGIIDTAQDVGANRAQMIGSLNGKILRLDPSTGEGVSSNPYFDATNPSSPQSRLWSLGFRNPYRASVVPDSGSHDPADGNPGAIIIGDVGRHGWEEINIAEIAGQNFGWPIFEGMGLFQGNSFGGGNIANPNAPNPLFDGSTCVDVYFTFGELIVQETQNPPSFPNPCDAGVQIPAPTPTHVHTRPTLAWSHAGATTRAKGFDSDGNAVDYDIDNPQSPIQGTPFSGSAVTGGMIYQNSDLPAEYSGNYFFGDYTGMWLRRLVFNSGGQPIAVQEFSDGGAAGGVVHIATNPSTGGIYFIPWTVSVNRLDYAPNGNFNPVVSVVSSQRFGPSPLTVSFDASATTDPEGSPLTFSWDFGDGNTATGPVVQHTFTAQGVATFDVVLTVSDAIGGQSTETIVVTPNNTPPTVEIVSPADGTQYPLTGDTTYDLLADIRDAEHAAASMSCVWNVRLHHDTHTHGGPPIQGCQAQAVISPAGCDGDSYFWRVDLSVTDPAGLEVIDNVTLLEPDCGAGNFIPVANGDLATVDAFDTVTVPVLANDIDDVGFLPASVTLTGPAPVSGNASIDFDTGNIVYAHTGVAGSIDTLRYTVDDTDGATSNEGIVVIRSLIPDSESPSEPGNFTAIGIATNQISLSWNASTDNVAVAGYRIDRNGAQIADLTTTNHVDQGLDPDTTYGYAIEAYDAADNVSTQANTEGSTLAMPQEVTITVQSDTYTRTNQSTSNYGTDTFVRVQPWGNMTGFARFDLSSLGASVSSATLSLPVTDVKLAGVVEIREVLGNWTELGLTANNQPSLGPPVTSFTVSNADDGQVLQVDVTALVNALLADPATDFGLALRQSGANVWFNSRESGSPMTITATLGGPPGNTAPQVNAGSDLSVTLPNAASLSGSVNDDGLPNPPGVTTVAWDVVSGPAAVSLGNPNNAVTTATFTEPGSYELRLTADDTELTNSDTLSVIVTDPNANEPPSVDAGTDFSVALNATIAMAGSVSDDGRPDPPGIVTSNWTIVSSPGGVMISNPTAPATDVSFDTVGDYALRLTADDGEFQVPDDVTVTVFDPSAQQVVTVVADTYTRTNQSTSNYGTDTIVRVQPWGNMTGFARFDLTSLGASVSSAILSLPVTDVKLAGVVEVREVLGNWTELGLTANNQPSLGPPVSSFSVSNADDGQVVQVDVTALVNALLADPATDFGLALRQSGANVWFNSRESGSPMTITATPGTPPVSTFSDITSSSNTAGASHFGGHGVQFADVDGDGQPDFYVTMNDTSFGPMSDLFYKNVDGNLFAEEAATRRIDNFDTGSHGGVFADIDNDGDLDLYNGSYDQNRLYENDGNGLFTDTTTAAGLPSRLWPTRGVAAFDMDLDGDLDIVGINGAFGSADPPSERNEIYRNNGNSTFTTDNLEPVYSATAGQGLTDVDFDNDGFIDIFAANRNGDVVILRNSAGAGFELIAPGSIGINHIAGDGISFGDVNNDGWLDALLDDQLYVSDQDGTFTHRASLTGPEIPYMGGFADLDNDGDKDIVFPGANFVYWNDGQGNFTAGANFSIGAIDDPRSVAFSDIDNDGDLDFFYAQKDAFNVLIRNEYAGTNRWLSLLLRRSSGQLGGFGARIYIYPSGQLDNAAALITWKEIRSQDGYLSQSDPRVLLGLGANDTVDIRVVFPGGNFIALENVSASQFLDIQE